MQQQLGVGLRRLEGNELPPKLTARRLQPTVAAPLQITLRARDRVVELVGSRLRVRRWPVEASCSVPSNWIAPVVAEAGQEVAPAKVDVGIIRRVVRAPSSAADAAAVPSSPGLTVTVSAAAAWAASPVGSGGVRGNLPGRLAAAACFQWRS